MKKLVFILFCFTTLVANAYPANVTEKAIEAVNLKCGVVYDLKNVDYVDQVDSVHDYATYSVFFKSGESVSISQIFDGGKNVSFWVDEVYCK